MSSEFAIRVRDVSKHYLMFDQPQDRLKQMIVPRLQRLAGRAPTRYFRDFAALNGVSFDVRRGETVGIIGRNGSGKSTLLQIICGTLQPSSGTVEVNGRIAALLELGAGFNPEFTGRENVFLSAAIMGLSRGETEARFDAIARFADIGMFIDQPVKSYSSGMYVRLAFATAINVDPDILVVDEALAVGDEAFQRKCYARIEDIKAKGGTILFVSHSAQTIVQLCDRAILIDAGELLLDGVPKAVVGQYQRLVNVSGDIAARVRTALKESLPQSGPPGSVDGVMEADGPQTGYLSNRDTNTIECEEDFFDASLGAPSRLEYPTDGASISDGHVRNSNGVRVNCISYRRTYAICYSVRFERAMYEVAFGMLIKTVEGLELAGGTTSRTGGLRLRVVQANALYHVRYTFENVLMPGTYFVNTGVSANINGGRRHVHRILDAMAFKVLPSTRAVATGQVDLVRRVAFQQDIGSDETVLFDDLRQ